MRKGKILKLKKKIYSEDEREILWLEKLDKQERWILGQRIDISKSNDTYYSLLAVARLKNKRLGYGDGTKDENRVQYEKDRRNIALLTRLKRYEENIQGNNRLNDYTTH